MKPISEKEFMQQVIALANLLGYRVAHFRPGMTRRGSWVTPVQAQGKGFPDLLLLKGRRCIAAELKSESGKTTREQEEWLAAFRNAGVEAYLWTPSDFDDIQRILGV